jgi:hypothetical protein
MSSCFTHALPRTRRASNYVYAVVAYPVLRVGSDWSAAIWGGSFSWCRT